MNRTVHRYDLPSVQGEGWATVFMTSDGFFSTVSDYGNYGYRWSNWGHLPFLEKFLDLSSDYILGKLAPEQHYDAKATHGLIVRAIAERRRGRFLSLSWTKEQAREEFGHLVGCDVRGGSEVEFADWYRKTSLGPDSYEYAVFSPSQQATAFCERVLPRLKQAIRRDLATAEACPS